MKYFVQHNTVYIVPLGECEDWTEACDKADASDVCLEGPSWVMSEQSLRELQANIEEALK